jgi:HAD superfamily hydrolase (TIGR01509 family)
LSVASQSPPIAQAPKPISDTSTFVLPSLRVFTVRESSAHGRRRDERPAGVVFDNDGLLLDTEPCWTRAQQAVFARRGRVFDLAAKQALVGTAPETAAAVLERLLDAPGSGRALADEMYALALDEIARGATPRPHALELVREARDVLPLAVASNAPRSHLLAGLRRTGLEDVFDAVLGVDDVENPKPSPNLYLRACELVGVPPAEAVALEDSPPGVAAARAAGLLVVGVPSVDGVELAADVVAPSLGDPRVPAALGLDAAGEPPA